MEGAFELAKQSAALLAERYPDHVKFADTSRRAKQGMVDLQLFAEQAAPDAAPPALSRAQAQQAAASGTLKRTADEGAAHLRSRPSRCSRKQSSPPRTTRLDAARQNLAGRAVRQLHARWAAEEAMLRRSQPGFSLQKELQHPEMRRLMSLPGMRMADAYRLAHYNDAMRRTAQAVEQGVVERIRQRSARPAENGTNPARQPRRAGCVPDDPDPAGRIGAQGAARRPYRAMTTGQPLGAAQQKQKGSYAMDTKTLNLQYFADAASSLENTTATMTAEMKTFYEKRLIDQAEPRAGPRPVCGLLPCAPEWRQEHRVPQV